MRLVTVALGVGGALESPHKADLASRILRDLNAFVPFQECADSLMSAFVCSSCAVCDSSAPLQSARAQDMSHRGEGKAVLVISQFSHNLLVSLNNTNTAKNLKLTQVEHACSTVRSQDMWHRGEGKGS